MNDIITIKIEREMWGNGQLGRAFVEGRIDPILLENSTDPGGALLSFVNHLMGQLTRKQEEVTRADKKAREEGRL